MLSRSARRISSTSSSSARAGVRSLVLGADKGEDAVYSSKTFEDGDASPSPGGTPIGSRRSSMSTGFAARRESVRAPFAMTSITTESSQNSPASPRTISTTAAASATVLPGISSVPFEGPTANAPAHNGSAGSASYEHGSYEFTPKELAAVKKRVEEEFLLKSVTSSTRPLSQQIRPSSKVPFEFSSTSEIVHPSGFVVPTSENSLSARPFSSESNETRHRTQDVTSNIRDSVQNFSGLRSMDSIGMVSRSGKVPQEVLLADGSAIHGSGFVPPTPQTKGMEGVKEVYKPAVRAH